MNRPQLITLGSAVFVLANARARGVIVNGLIGFGELVQRLHEERCSSLSYRSYFLWDRFDPTCPQCF